MGFGLLLCAYFLLTFMSVGIGDYCYVTYLLGALVASRAVEHQLKAYNPRFRLLYIPTALYALLAVYFTLLAVDDVFLLGLPLRGTVVTAVVSWVQFITELSFSVVALWSSAEIAASVGLDRHRDRAKRNLVFVCIWGIAQLLLLTIPALAAAGNQTPVKLLLLYQLVVYLLCCFSFYGCFTAICPAGEEFGKPSKPSRFKFINDINAKLDEKNERARLEYEKSLQEPPKKYSAKNNNRHHKKKK